MKPENFLKEMNDVIEGDAEMLKSGLMEIEGLVVTDSEGNDISHKYKSCTDNDGRIWVENIENTTNITIDSLIITVR